MAEAVLTANEVTKHFPGVTALSGVNFRLFPGEVHALLGENGAGKSSLIKILTGVYKPDSGNLKFQGRDLVLGTPQDAVNQGISTVYQEVNLLPNLSIAENIVLGRESRSVFGIRWKDLYERAENALTRVGLKLDVRKPLYTQSIANQQLIAIARSLDVSAKVLILDEPTSSLDENEVETLFNVMRGLREQGLAIVFVTHFLDQVFAVSDRITVLRNGKFVAETPIAVMTREELIHQMVGREVSSLSERDQGSLSGKPLLTFKNVSTSSGLKDVSLEVTEGGTIGIAGLLGSGRTECLNAMFGVDKVTSGTLSFEGTPVGKHSVRAAIKKGIAFCTEDRKATGIFPDLSIRENIAIVAQNKRGIFKPFVKAQAKKMADEMIAKLRIATPDAEKPIKELSGGNQQKVLLARWLVTNPKVILLDEPTRGIDIGAKEEIMRFISELRASGSGVVFVSSELPEVVRVCNPVTVLHEKRQVATLSNEQITEDEVKHQMSRGKAS